MHRFLLLLLCLFALSASANSPLQIEKRLGLSSKSTELTPQEQLSLLEDKIHELVLTENSARELLNNYAKHKQNLLNQIQDAQKTLNDSDQQDINQQASLAYLRLSELKDVEISLGQKINALIKSHSELPDALVKARAALQKHKKIRIGKEQTINNQLIVAQGRLYEQDVKTLEAVLASSQKEIDLNQLQLKLVREQLAQQELLIERLNQKIVLQREARTEATIAGSLLPDDNSHDPIAQELSDSNLVYGENLKKLNQKISLTLTRQEKAEAQYQAQAKQLTTIQQQIGWIKLNSAFGERFLQMLQALPKPPNQEPLQSEIANTRLARYQIEQAQTLNSQQVTSIGADNSLQAKLLSSQGLLLQQLLQSYDQYLSELADLRVSYEQLNQQYLTLKSTLNDHLFWVPNANSIGGLWITDLHQSIQWMLQQAPWGQMQSSFDEQSTLWSLWLILFVISIITQDILTPKFKSAMRRELPFVGNVTQDKFIYTFHVLINSLGYSLLKPLPIVFAGGIFYQSSHNFVSAIGMGIMALGLLYQLYRFIYLLALDRGLLINHFKAPKSMVRSGQARFRKFTIMATPFLAIMAFTEVIDTSLVRNSLGRGAFIIFCLMLFWFYKDMLSLSNKENTAEHSKNKKLLQKLLWAMLIIMPLACAVLAFQGYYYTAFQMFLQLQLSLIFGLGFLLLFNLIKRWMLIERRRIAFERAKAKRAEVLAQREKGELNVNDQADTYEEPIVDLETISSQSLGLVRSLLLLAFLASIVGLWTQTHTALFSLLDGVTLWSSNTTVNGIDQQLPITLKSLLLSLIIVGFSMMIATNLPGLIELTILQRLDLSQGTGFALTTVSRYLVVMFGVLAGFSTLGMEWSKLQWLVAALSVGLGFGLQEIFANFISGLIILFEKPVRIGDTVTIRDLTGTVSKIQIRATTIIDWDRKEIIVPNKAFITEQLINWSLSDPITRVIIYVSVARDSDPARVEAALYQAVQECDDALLSPEPEVWFAGFGQHTQDFEVRAYAKDMGTRWPLRHKLHKQISKKLRENNLELAYPQLEVHLSASQNKEVQSLLRT
ncbi:MULTISPECIES: mechanosensitive ion channel domain-containing protein [unclassified Shewanella]|uniref:mechanosensitive ion channel domain-containing protein n=1 Tax=unclassified Shewanella TaxID=196818 RepID=UPI001BC0CC4D|nr:MULTISPECIES: mechanosensitive ion channel domain-containing protein [unclassified Shewanella]GIU06212.1 mechanosensitive ion channel protein MscS [Shewanella sp. MBTL60-112-B1]GIU25307.1 mechanosensitive ion channel protein MscS [Shewanella sp. MBTL60-112-B2]